MEKQTLSEAVKEMMKAQGISQTTYANKLGMSQGSLSRDLRRNVEIPSLIRFIEGLGGSVFIKYPTGKTVKLKSK
jgi:transcriptional regulator with XRE-family HTH domain